MIRLILLPLAITILLIAPVKAQISLIGVSTPQSGGVEVVTWNALDSTSVQTYPTDLVGYYLASSVFDAYNGDYMLAGLTESDQGLFKFNTKTLEQELAGFTSFSNITEIDMSTGKIYNLNMVSEDYIQVNEYDIETGQDSLLGEIFEPGASGIIVESTAFNSNDGIMYYLGFDSIPNLCLYAIPVRDEIFSFSKIILTSDNMITSYFGLNYDNVNNTIFALNPVYDSLLNYSHMNLSEIDPLTGETTARADLSEFMGFVVGSSAFDQFSGSYMVNAIDTNNQWKMLVFDTYTNTYVTGWSPDGASEIVCDNTAFATATYITTGITEPRQSGLTVYPNPAVSTLSVSHRFDGQNETLIRVFDVSGKDHACSTVIGEQEIKIDVSGLKPGMYIVQIRSGNELQTARFIR